LIRIGFSITIIIALKIFQSRSAEKISIKVCLEIFNQGLTAKS